MTFTSIPTNERSSSIAPPGFWPDVIRRGATMIMITRDHDFYYCSRRNGQGCTDQLGQRIDAARAREIVESNPDGRVIGTSPVNWGPGAHQFTWVCEVEE